MSVMKTKEQNLVRELQKMDKLAVAYSGGIDSSYLLKKALVHFRCWKCTCGCCKFRIISDDEFDKTVDLANGLGANVLGLEMSELADDRIVANNPNSWFYSKKLLYKTIRSAIQKGFDVLADGMIMDDNTDFRPGLRARIKKGSSVRYNKLNYIKLKYVNLLKTQVFPIECLM